MPNHYDRLFKENIEPLIPLLARKIFGLKFSRTEDIKDKIQVTVEAEADYLKKVLHRNSADDYILHIEFQVKDDRNMLSRMLLYRAFLYNKYRLPVRQFVFYVGRIKPKMALQLVQDNLIFEFEMRNIHDFPYDLFINSTNPEEVILTILSDFKNQPAKVIITKILNQLKQLETPTQNVGKYVTQLEVLSKLRNLQEETANEILIMPFTYDIKTDIRYKQGVAQTREQVASYLLTQTTLTIKQIAIASGLTVNELNLIKSTILKSSVQSK